MTQITIPAQVVNGRLQHESDLAAYEGKHVLATLTLAPENSASANGTSEAPTPELSEEFDPEPPDWLDIEHDVYFPVTVPTVSLGKVNVRIEKGKPCIILPEELPDE